MKPYAWADVRAAFERHITDPDAGRFPPKPADVIRHLQPRAEDDGHPGADEAWGLLLRLIRDERETGVLTDPMRAGWATCQPILDQGDEVGARKCFLEVYQRQVQEARKTGQGARWSVTLGTCPRLRIQRLQEAVAARRIDFEAARSLLPGPSPESIGHVAGLLAGPDATPDERQTAERLRTLAKILRRARAEDDQQRAEKRQRQIEADRERRQAIQTLIDTHENGQKRDAA